MTIDELIAALREQGTGANKDVLLTVDGDEYWEVALAFTRVRRKGDEPYAHDNDFPFTLVTDGEPDLSARQLAILPTMYLQPPPHPVRALAAKLKVTKPVITRALDTMGKIGLVARRRDQADRRNVVIQRTAKGALAVERLGDVLIAKARELPR